MTRDELERAVAVLKQQNELLAKQVEQARTTGGKGKSFEVELGEYKGHPVLSFRGNFPPWRKSAKAIATILAHADKVADMCRQAGHDPAQQSA